MFKRSPSLTEQVKAHLKERIINAEFGVGRIPSEMHLAEELNVSRNTIRDALGRLEMEGVIFRRQGAGTFVNEANLLVKTRLEEIVPYSTLIEEQGYRPTVELIGVEKKSVSSDLIEKFDSDPADSMLVIQKLFRANDQPVIFTHTIIPTHLIKQTYTTADLLKPTYNFLPNFCGETLAYFLTDIVPLIATDALTEKLGLPATPTPLLSFEEMGYNQDNQLVAKAASYFRDDLLRLRLIRRPGG